MSILVSEIVPATQELLDIISSDMRPSDIREVWASDRMRPKEAVDMSFKNSEFTSILMFDGEPVTVFGLGYEGDEIGVPWMLSSLKVLNDKREMLRAGKHVVDTMLKIRPVLVNRIHANNRLSMNWVKHLGFTVLDAEPNEYGEMFHPFVKRREDV